MTALCVPNTLSFGRGAHKRGHLLMKSMKGRQGRMQTLEMRGAQQGFGGAAPRKFFQGSAVPNAGVDPSIHFINDFYSILAEKNLY